MSEPIQVVESFIQHINSGQIDKAMDHLSENVFYHNIPLPPINGREAAREFAHAFGMGSRLTSSWKTVAIAAAGEVVLTERVDDFITEDGGRISIPLMGSFRVRNGEIVEWRDYFDLGDLTRQAERANIAL
ncbi:MAG TPA: limonene-1,2-epoxide hydrolase family protein [Pyrinomonadaceae bacterium]|uniref:limonene-1,2-epoxide hydrolase family protein n=1 Tax=Pseudomonas citri TaxID=2978349 RepID=UPI0021B5FBE8|nr:limonene-1,2-epoxide hydrolase family protein [Pseudomonas citri]HKY46194.1 limonene-1,2-epoxide hydrolase family protein [Pyrinomonadaceae bacterium]